jgi:hypothetical protein
MINKIQNHSRTLPLLFIIAIFSLNFISAQSAGYYGNFIADTMNKAINLVQDFLGPVFAVLLGDNGNFFFEKILFLFIIFAVVYVALKKVPIFADNAAVIWVISIAASLLATRFLSDTQLVNNVMLPYSILGVALTAGLPLIIFFFFVESMESSVLRKIFWCLFLVVFFGLWSSRYDELGDLSYIYFFTGVAALILLLADGTIRRALIKQQMNQLGINSTQNLEREVLRQIQQTDQDLARSIITPSQHASIKRRLQNQLKALRKN